MLILGILLLVLGFVLGIQILWILGIVLAVLGAVLMVVPIGGTRRRWY